MKRFKIIVDILLLVTTVLLLDIEITSRLFHEILGIGMAILILIHIVLNWNLIKQVTRNLKKVNTKTKIMYLVDVLTAIIYIGTIVFGIIVSNELFKFKTASNSKLILTHMAFGRLAIIIMLLHVGMHLDRILKNIKSKKTKIILYIIYIVISLAISIYSLYALTHSFWWMMEFGMNF